MLLERTFEHRRDRFDRLIFTVVKHGLTYRQKKGDAIRREEIETLNGLLLQLEMKLPDLWSPTFLNSLTEDAVHHAGDIARSAQQTVEDARGCKSREDRLSGLCAQFYALWGESDRQKAGRDLEILLNDLFTLFCLEPRKPFRIVGEQIDGSIVLDNEVYLVEAKWTSNRISENELLVFRGKVTGKSQFTRGFFISINGFTHEAEISITQGKQPNFFLLDGYDLVVVLEGHRELPDMLRFKLRQLADEGRVFVSAREMP